MLYGALPQLFRRNGVKMRRFCGLELRIRHCAEEAKNLVILLVSKARRDADKADKAQQPLKLATWKDAAASYAKRVLEIREANPNTKAEDLALALELQADVYQPAGSATSRIRIQRAWAPAIYFRESQDDLSSAQTAKLIVSSSLAI